jgi:hypothetical protein
MLDVGIHKISNEEYYKDLCPEPSLSRSTIQELLFHSPAHAKFNHPRLNPGLVQEEAEKFDIGSAAHSLLLEGIDNCVVIEADDWRKKEAREVRDQARTEGKFPLLKSQYDKTLKMVESAKEQIKGCKELGITDLLTEGDSELSYIWKEKSTFLRIRPDWIFKDRKLIIDYKTTGNSANPSEFSRSIVSNGYDIQAALYSRGVKAIEGIEPKFIFVVQEITEPYLCSFIGLPPEFLEMGKQKVDYGIFLWEQCMTSGIWTGYPQQVCWVDTPAWALSQWEQIAERIGI